MKAIVTGVTGQDGYYMARLLLARGYAVVGLTRDLAQARAHFADAPGGLRLVGFDYANAGEFGRQLPLDDVDLIFNFAARATGQGMFDAPFEIARLNGFFVVDILEAIRHSGRGAALGFCQASSSEMFGNVTETPQSERTPFRPKSPYGAAKRYAHDMVGIYRATYGLRCSSAILYNHESVRRSLQFVTKKIAHAAASIKLGRSRVLTLGSLEGVRDWGHAPEYVEAMYRMAVAPEPQDFVVATGRLSTVRDLCEIAFGRVGLDYRDYVETQKSDFRPVDSIDLHGDPSLIRARLGWVATRTIGDVMIEMVDHELAAMGAEPSNS
jgi:GDPmannose 4,6-dehydratase